MTDYPNPDDVSRVTPAEAARAVNPFDPVTSEDIRPSGPGPLFSISEERAIRAVKSAEEFAAVSNATLAGHVLTQNSTGQLYYRLTAPLNTPDEDWVKYQRADKIRQAQLELPEQLWSDLSSAMNEEHFQFLFNRAKHNWKAAQEIQASSWLGWKGANLLVQMVNPVDLGIAVGTYYLGGTAAQLAFNLGRRGALVGDALAGAAGAAGSVAAQDALGLVVDESEYMMAAGLGLVIGGGISLFAPSGVVGAQLRQAGSPTLAREFSERLAAQGQKMIKEAIEKSKAAAAKMSGSSPEAADEIMAALKAAQEPASPPDVASRAAFAEPRQAPAKALTEAPPTAPAPTVGDAAEALVRQTPIGEALPPGTVKQLVDEAVAQAAPEARPRAEADPTTQPGALTKPFATASQEASKALDDAVSRELAQEVALDARWARDPRNLSQFRGPNGTFLLRAETEDLSGPYMVSLVGPDGRLRTVASGIDTLAEARASVPGLVGPYSAGRVGEGLVPIQRTGPADALFAIPADSKAKAQFEAALAKIEKLLKKDIDAILNDFRNRPTGGTFKWKSKNKADALRLIRETWTERAAAREKHAVIKRLTSWDHLKDDGSAALAEAKPLAGKVDEIGGGYSFRGFEYRLTDKTDDSWTYEIFAKDGRKAGDLEIATQDGRRYIAWQGVEDEFKNTPAAYGAYLVAQRHGVAQIPDGSLSAESFPMWAKRLPWVREFYREDPLKPGWMRSPKYILKELEGLLNSKASLESLKESYARRGEPWTGSNRNNEKRLDKNIQAYKRVIDGLPPEALDPDNLARMFYAKSDLRDPMAGSVSKPEVRALVDEVLARVLPKGVGRQVADEIDPRGALDGLYKDRVVYVALNADNPVAIAYHETTHALRQLGLITKKEWNKLVNWARKTGAHEKYRLQERYGAEGLSREALDEEAVAHALADKLAGRALGEPAADGIMDRLVDVFRWIRDALGVRGFRTVRDLFDDIDSGIIAQRPLVGDLNDAAFRAARRPASSLVTGAQNYLEATNPFQAITEQGVPYSGGWGRFDIAGRMGKSLVAAERLIGRHLLSDPVGLADHSLTPTGANTIQRQLHDKMIYRYGQTAKAAFDRWADDEGLSIAQRWARFDEFFEQVGLFMRNRALTPGLPPPHPAVGQLADKIGEIQADYLKLFKDPMAARGKPGTGRALPGSNIDGDVNYLWRKYNYDKVQNYTARLSDGEMVKLFRAAIKDRNPDFSDELLDRFAEGYFRQLHRAAVGLEDNWGRALHLADAKTLKNLLKQDLGISEQEAEGLVRKMLSDKADPDVGAGFLKRRAILNDTFEMDLRARDGSTVRVAVSDLLENNVNHLMEHYSRQSSGLVAMASTQIRSPDGTLLVNGIVNDSEFADLIQNVAKWAADRGLHHQAADSIQRLQWAYDRVLGRPQPWSGTNWSKVARLIRAYMTLRLMGQGGVAQLGETGTTVGTMGVAAAFSHFPAMKRIVDNASGDLVAKSQLVEDISLMGLGPRFARLRYRNVEEIGQAPYQVENGTLMDRFLRWGRVGEDLTHILSGMTPIQERQTIWTAEAIATRFANLGRVLSEGGKIPAGWERRLAQVNIDPPMLKRIFDELRQNNQLVDNPIFPGQKVHQLRMEGWKDLEARAHFEQAVYRLATKLIQQGDEGMLASWMHHDIAKVFIQFRNFPLAAWSNHFQYNLHMRDPQMVFNFIWSTGWAAVVRALQIKALAATRSDKKEYEEKYLSLWELGKAGFERSGWSSIIPMGVDTATTLLGIGPAFSSRTTGQVSSIFGIPPLSTADALAQGLGGAVNAYRNGRPMSQQEIRAAASVLPWTNVIPVASGLSYLISDRPERAPKEKNRIF